MGDLYMLLCMWSWDKAATLLPTLTDEQVHTNLSLKSELDDSSSLHTAICAMPLDLLASLLEKSSLVNKKCVLAIMSDGCDCYTALHCFAEMRTLAETTTSPSSSSSCGSSRRC